MNNFLIVKDNIVTNKIKGNNISLNEGEILIEATGSYDTVSPRDYYLSSSNTFYKPLYPSITFSSSSEFFEGMVSSSITGITASYTENITPVPTISNITSNDLLISNFSSNSNSFRFEVQATDETINSTLDTVKLEISVKGVTDTNSNPVWSHGNTETIFYTLNYTSSI